MSKQPTKKDPKCVINRAFDFVGPTDLEVKSDTTTVSVFWNEAVLPEGSSKAIYRLSLRYEGVLVTNGTIYRSKKQDPVHKYSCKFSDLWTGTPYKLTILTVSNDQIWDPPIIMEVKTKKGKNYNFYE